MAETAANAQDGLLAKVKRASLDLPGARKSIADFLLREGSGVANLSMAEVADLTFTSKPSLVRFSKGMGFSGWRDFRFAFVTLMREREEKTAKKADVDPNHPFSGDDDLRTVVNNIALLEQRAIADASAHIDKGMLAEAANRVLRARSLVFFGAEPNSHFGMVFAYKLRQIGRVCFVPTREEWPMIARGLEPQDCAIIASYSGVGPQRQPVSFLSLFNDASVPSIAITNSGSNWLRENCDCVLSFKPVEHYYSKISGFYSERCVELMLDALFGACFAANYDQNEIIKLKALVSIERQQHVEDVLPY